VGCPADAYALGCVAHFLLTGKPPFQGTNLVEVWAAHIHGVPSAPSTRAPLRVSAALDALVLRCLAKNPAERPSMAELNDLLHRLMDAEWAESTGVSTTSAVHAPSSSAR
jgi:serine/threonine-protein kinase